MAGPSLKVIAFNAANAGIIPTYVIQASDTEPAATKKKEHVQHSGAVPAGNPVKTVMAAPAANPSLKTVTIPGYSGPA